MVDTTVTHLRMISGLFSKKMGDESPQQVLDRYPPLAYSPATRIGIHERVRAVT
jgi:hypothetical protein